MCLKLEVRRGIAHLERLGRIGDGGAASPSSHACSPLCGSAHSEYEFTARHPASQGSAQKRAVTTVHSSASISLCCAGSIRVVIQQSTSEICAMRWAKLSPQRANGETIVLRSAWCSRS